MSIFVATKPLSRHSRERIGEGFDQHADRSPIRLRLQTQARPARGNPVLNLVRSTQSIDLTSNDKDPGFPPKARGNDAHAEGAL